MDTLKKIFNWIVWSSSDPEKISLTIKAGVPAMLWLLMFSGHGNLIGNDLIDQIIAAFVKLLQTGVQFALAGAALFGLLRKVWYLFFPKPTA